MMSSNLTDLAYNPVIFVRSIKLAALKEGNNVITKLAGKIDNLDIISYGAV